MNKTDMLLKQRDSLQNLIQRADTKASAILVVLGILFNAFIDIFEMLTNSWYKYVFIVLFSCSFVALLVFVIFVFFPRAKRTGVLYLNHSLNMSLSEYKNKFITMDESSFIEELIEQLYFLESILSKKNIFLKFAFLTLIIMASILMIGIGLTAL